MIPNRGAFQIVASRHTKRSIARVFASAKEQRETSDVLLYIQRFDNLDNIFFLDGSFFRFVSFTKYVMTLNPPLFPVPLDASATRTL